MPIKIGNVTVDGPKKTLLVLPRQEGDVVFKFIAVTDDDEFDKICPPPKAAITRRTDGSSYENVEDPKYKEQVKNRSDQRFEWFFLKSIEPSAIEWQTVKMEDPYTYASWRKELGDAGFSIREVSIIHDKFLETNILTDKMLDEARQRFLASQQADQSASQ